MLSNVRTDDAELEENISKNHCARVSKNSLHDQSTRPVSKEKAVSPRGIRSVRLQDKRGFLMSGKPVERNNSARHSSRAGKTVGEGAAPCTSHRKPWPSRKATGGEEVVKYMSNIPSYLQRMERGDTVQEKALNFGVIDWGRLEKWAYGGKQAVDERVGSSTPTSSASSVSTSGSVTQSGRGIGGTLAQRKKSPPLNRHSDPSAKARQTKMREEDNTRHVEGFLHSRTSHGGASIGHHQISETYCNVGTDHSGLQHEKGKGKDSDMRTIARNMAQPPDINTSDPTSKDHCDTSGVPNNMVKVQHRRSTEAEKPHSSKQVNHCSSVGHPPEDQHLFSKDIEGMWDHRQESTIGGCSSIESMVFGNRSPTGVRRDSFSLKFPPENVQLTNLSPHVPHSCPLPSTIECDESFAATTPHSKIEVPIPQSGGTREKQYQFTEGFVDAAVDKLGHCSSVGLNWMKRSSSLKEVSSVGQMKWTTSPDNSHEDKEATRNRGRRSPLRRILDPFLKSKNHTLVPKPIAGSSIDGDGAHDLCIADRPPESTSRYGPRKLFGSTTDSFTSEAIGNLNSSFQVSSSSHVLIQDEAHMPPTRQALLQLSWKNGMPVFMLSSNDNNILAATMRKKNISNKCNFECVFTILSIHEVKKKSGVWINQRNKSKKRGLVSNVVGQLQVVSSELKGNSVVREFVLLGADQMPAAHEPLNSVFKSELAAIIVEIPKEISKSTHSGFLGESLQFERNPENSSLISIVALLPSEIHGFSAAGEPSPLIERWKSGGNCDCGGWDEGCILTILTDKPLGSKGSGAVHACPTTDGAHQIELFVQGGVGENRHAFSMVACKEGLYTIEFRTSIALLQAFAICIAVLHDWKPTNHFSVHDSIEAISFQEQMFADNTKRTPATTLGGAPASYVPHHPPPSPVGRA